MHKLCYWLMLLIALPFSTYAAENYSIDAQQSNARFSVSHFLFLTTPGRFDKISGKITLDRVAKNGSIDVAIEAGSINTNHAKRDENLRSPNFFDTTKHPYAHYKSSAIQFINDTPTSVEGTLILLGVSKPVTLTISAFNCDSGSPGTKETCSAIASTQIKRSDFGMKYALPLIGDEIKLMFEIEASEESP